MSSSDFIFAINSIKGSVCNKLAISNITNKPFNISTLFTLSDSINSVYDIIDELSMLTEKELYEIGFDYHPMNSSFMIMPVWIYLALQSGTELDNIDGTVHRSGEDSVEFIKDEWVDVGFILETI